MPHSPRYANWHAGMRPTQMVCLVYTFLLYEHGANTDPGMSKATEALMQAAKVRSKFLPKG